MPKEKNLDNCVLHFLESIGAWRIKYWGGAKFTKSGIPDILACIDGYFFGIEDKAKNGKPTLLQLKNLQWIRESGGFGILLYPDDFENFKKFVDEQYQFTGISTTWQSEWYNNNIKLQLDWVKKLEKI